jgi:hypothetical protein
MTPDFQIIETIHERDTDLILLEELNTNDHFIKWFVKTLELPKLTKNNGTWRSISDFGLGETDLLFSYQSNQKKIFILIENKLDANFQDLQFERYQKRGDHYLSENKCCEYFSLLIAPKQYTENQNNFERYLTYEEIKEYFEISNDIRLQFKAKLLNIAIEKLRRGYQPINSEPVQRFWQSYWEYIEQTFPHFKMKKPSIVPVGSDWPEMRFGELKGVIFFHKLAKGFIDATFVNYTKEIEIRIKEILPPNYIFEKHKSGKFSIRQITDPIQRKEDFKTQIEQVQMGLYKMDEVQKWIIKNL